jgi:hypothetical protein
VARYQTIAEEVDAGQAGTRLSRLRPRVGEVVIALADSGELGMYLPTDSSLLGRGSVLCGPGEGIPSVAGVFEGVPPPWQRERTGGQRIAFGGV